jgi:hypothetical protein
MTVVMAALVGLLLTWLIQGLRGLGQLKKMQQQYAMQYWQYQQWMYSQAAASAPPPTQPVPPQYPGPANQEIR